LHKKQSSSQSLQPDLFRHFKLTEWSPAPDKYQRKLLQNIAV